jgi:hypothetical protein
MRLLCSTFRSVCKISQEIFLKIFSAIPTARDGLREFVHFKWLRLRWSPRRTFRREDFGAEVFQLEEQSNRQADIPPVLLRLPMV